MIKTDLTGRLEIPIVVDIKSVKFRKDNPNYISGIYKITSPSGRIYIGQATNIETRFYTAYRHLNCKKQRLIRNSLLKYGIENHLFEIIHVVNNLNTNKLDLINLLNILEEQCILEFKSFVDDNEKGLNLSSGGKNRIHSEQSKKKISDWNKGKTVSETTREKIRTARTGTKSSEESNKKNREARLGEKNHFYGKKHTEEAKGKMRKWRNENQQGENHPFLNKKHSDETKKKLRDAKLGSKMSEENKKMHSEMWSGDRNPMAGSARFGDKNPMFGKKQSEETKEKIRAKNKGKKHTKESLEKMSKSQKGRTHSEETKKKQSNSRKLYLKLKKIN